MRAAGADLGVPVGHPTGGGPHGIQTAVRAVDVPLFSQELGVDGSQRGGRSRFSCVGGTTTLSADAPGAISPISRRSSQLA